MAQNTLPAYTFRPANARCTKPSLLVLPQVQSERCAAVAPDAGLRDMLKALRVIAGILLAGFLLYLASGATQDCSTGLLAYENCWWLWVRERCGLPANKLLRAGFLELVGLLLLAGLILTCRYVLPPRSRPPVSHENSQ